jgi:hypothetical protein
MRFLNCLNRLRRTLRRGSASRRPEKCHRQPRVEQLEDRLVPATLFVDVAGDAHYIASNGVNNNVTLGERLVFIPPFRFALQDVITDTAEKINVVGPGAGRWTGSGTNQVSTLLPIPNMLLDVEDGNDVVNVQATNYNLVVRHTGPGTDTVTVGNADPVPGFLAPPGVQGISKPLLVTETGTGSSTHLLVDDSPDTVNRPFVQLASNQVNNLAPAPIGWLLSNPADAVTVSGGSGNDNYTVLAQGVSTTLNTGKGFDNVTVQAATAPLTINGANNLLVNVGNSASGLEFFQGPISVTNSAAHATMLNVNDFADPVGRTINVSDTGVTFSTPLAATVHYQASGLGLLTIDGSNGTPSNVWNVLNTPGGTTTVLNTNTDGVNVQATTGALTVQNAGFVNVGKGGSVQGIQGQLNLTTNALTVDDSADPVGQHVLFSSNVLVGLAPARINYNFNLFSMRVKAGTGANSFTVADTPTITSAFYTTLDTGTGSDSITVLRTTTPLFITSANGTDNVDLGGGSLANFQGFVYLSNTLGKDHLLLDDSLDTVNRTVDIADGAGSGTVNGLTPAKVSIFYYDVSDLTIKGGKAGDYFRLDSPTSQTPITINAGPNPFNTLAGSNANNQWHITNTNAGTVGNVTFTGMQDLAAGTGNDSFIFSNGAGVTGFIGGGIGFNTLDYSAYTTPVFVNLQANTATGVGIDVFNIKRVIGGSGGNVLIGDSVPGAVLIGGSGRDVLIAGPAGGTVLEAGSGEAILIGGTTVWDANVTALKAILAEWSHTYDPSNTLDDYQIRVAHLEHGGGLNGPFLLNPATVHSNLSRDVLLTNLAGGLDFVFFDAFDVLPNPHRPGEVYVPV